MKNLLIALVLIASMGCATTTILPSEKENSMKETQSPPDTKVADPGDVLHGVSVHDPYQWLEDEKAEDVQAWMEVQDTYTRGILNTLPLKETLAKRLEELLYVETVSTPTERGDYLFFTRKGAKEEKSIYYARTKEGVEKVILDPHKLSEDLSTSVGIFIPSPDGTKVAYTLQENNADEATLYVMDVATGKNEDTIPGAKYAYPSWTPDGSGFYYTYLPLDPSIATDERPGYADVRYHALGTDAQEDVLIHPHTGSPETFIGPDLSHDGRWLFVSIHHGWNRDDVYRMDLQNKDAGFVPFAVDHPAHFQVLTHGDFHYILTDIEAPTKKLMRTSVDTPEMTAWQTVIPADPKIVLEDVVIAGGKLISAHLENASSKLWTRELDGSAPKAIELPGIGTARALKADRGSDTAYFQFSSFTTPPAILSLALSSAETTLWNETSIPADMTPYLVEQVHYPSKDGTLISMFIIRKKDMKFDGKTPLLLYGYGGFNISLLPSFVSTYVPWLEQGGAFAIPNLRGGGEYGEAWHKAGMKHNKQNVFDDYIAAAEYLIEKKYTQPSRLAIRGGSNGGLLVGAAMTQRPELYGAVSCAVPLLDMVRYHLYGSGRTWIPEYGSAEDEAEFNTLHAYSPYHHVKPNTAYPATLILTSDHDDRVDPLHARKMAALLQKASTNQTLLRIERNAGHGGADKVSERVQSAADSLSFLLHALGVRPE